MITFAVANVERSRKTLPSATIAESMRIRSNREFEAAACNVPHLVQSGSLHGFLGAVHTAFDSHYPLVLSPDDVWLCLAQGFAIHVNLHAEALRHRFVRHEGKLELTVRRDDFVKGSSGNDWSAMFSELSDLIAEHIGKTRELFVADFSTTGPIERAASQIVLFEAMQQYFDYGLASICGIPEITLLGTVDDWLSIRKRAQMFAEFELPDLMAWFNESELHQWAKSFEQSHLRRWLASLLPILDTIVQTARGEVDPAFWHSLYKYNGGSGGPYVTGWINVFFPYLETQDHQTNERTPVPNEHAIKWEAGLARHSFGGPKMDAFPMGLSSAPFTWNYLGTLIPMVFMGGFVGVSQDPTTSAVRPAIGWAIGEK